MCRFALYLGSPILISALVTEPTHSIIHQSFHSLEREEPLNGDGFGVAWYVPTVSPRPAVFKSITPAWNNINLASLARVTHSGCIMAHVRAATPGLAVTELNCHPFAHGTLAFMHNGHVGGFARFARRLRAGLSDEAYGRLQGTTDSELLFAMFTDHHARRTETDAGERLANAMLETIGHLEATAFDVGTNEPSFLNMAVSDGDHAVVTRYVTGSGEHANSLYITAGHEFVCEDGVCHMHPGAARPTAVLVASEPLSKSGDWQRIASNTLVLIGRDLDVAHRAIP